MKQEKLEKILVKIIFWSAVLMMLVPLIVVKQSWFPYLYYKTVTIFWLTEISLVAYIVLSAFDKKYRPRFRVMEWLLSAFGLIYLFTTFLGLSFERSWWGDWGRFEGTYLILHFIVWAIILANTLKDQAIWQKLFKIFVHASLAVAFLGFLQLAGVDWAILPATDRISSTLGNAGYYSSYALMSFFLAVYLWFTSGLGLIRWYFFGASLVNLSAVLFTGTRGAVIGLGVALVYYLYVSLRKKLYLDKVHKLPFIICASAVGLAMAVGILSQTTAVKNIHLFSRFTEVSLESSTVQTRFEAWKYGWQGFKENWLFGVGPENYNIVFDAHLQPVMYEISGSEIWFQRSHNKLIDQAVMTGIFGLITYLLIYVYLFIYLNRALRQEDLSFSSVLGLRLFLIGYFVQNFFIFDNQSTYVLYFLLIAFLIKFGSKKDSRAKKIEGARHMSSGFAVMGKVAVVGSVLLIGFSMLNLRFLRSNAFVIKALNNRYSQPSVFNESFQKAIELSVHPIDVINEYASKHSLLYAQGAYKNYPQEKLISDMTKLAGYQDQALRGDPQNLLNSYHYFNTAFNLYLETQDKKWLDKAEELVKHSLSLSPLNIRVYWQKYQLAYYGQNDPAKGAEALNEAIAIAPEVADTYWLMAFMYFAENDEVEAYKYTDMAIDKGYYFKIFSDAQLVVDHYYETEDWHRLAYVVDSMAQLKATDPDLYFSLVDVLVLDKKYDRAIEVLKNIIAMDPALTDKVVGQIISIKELQKNEIQQ